MGHLHLRGYATPRLTLEAELRSTGRALRTLALMGAVVATAVLLRVLFPHDETASRVSDLLAVLPAPLLGFRLPSFAQLLRRRPPTPPSGVAVPPAAAAAAAVALPPPAVACAATLPTARRSVLLVEDDPPLREAMQRHLREAGFDVVTASTYATATARIAEHRFEAIYVDLCLPTESGYELCEYIRGNPATRFTPIVVASQHTSPEDMSCSEDAGANAFMKKPFSMRLLDECLHMLMAGGAESRPSIRRLR